MPLLADDVLRALAGFRGDGVPVTSLYLDVDGRRYPTHSDVERQLDALLRDGRSRHGDHPSVRADLQRIEDLVRGGLDRSRTRGLAVFSCSERDLWEVVTVPVPVPNRLVVNTAPAVSDLEAVMEAAGAIGVLLVDRQRTRMLVFELGELTDHTEAVEELPRDVDLAGGADRGDKVGTAISTAAHQHLKRAADTAFELHRHRPLAHLAVAAPDDLVAEVEALLHPYLRDRLCGRLHLSAGAGLDEIRAAAIDLEARIERRREAEEVAQLREAVGTGRRGAAGLAAVLDALNQRRVDRLLVSQGYREAGWWCEPCGRFASVGRRCKACGADMRAVDDVVEETIEVALAQGCRVEICVGNADLDVLGRIGALLRY